MIHKVDHNKSLLFFLSRDFWLQRLHMFCTLFSSVTRRQEREREREREREKERERTMLKQCLKLRPKVKESFVKLVNFFRQSRYIYTLYNVAFGHFIPSTAYLVYKLVSIIDLSLSDVEFSV